MPYCDLCQKELPVMDEFTNVPGTWSYELNEHFKGFSQYCWDGFDKCSESMREEGVDKMNWREYLLHDMQRRHDFEKGGNNA